MAFAIGLSATLVEEDDEDLMPTYGSLRGASRFLVPHPSGFLKCNKNPRLCRARATFIAGTSSFKITRVSSSVGDIKGMDESTTFMGSYVILFFYRDTMIEQFFSFKKVSKGSLDTRLCFARLFMVLKLRVKRSFSVDGRAFLLGHDIWSAGCLVLSVKSAILADNEIRVFEAEDGSIKVNLGSRGRVFPTNGSSSTIAMKALNFVVPSSSEDIAYFGYDLIWRPIEEPSPSSPELVVSQQVISDTGTTWAILIAGLKGYGNYRHQGDRQYHSDVLSFQKLVGMADIIMFMYNDIAHHPNYPRLGTLINHPQGRDVYAGDYNWIHVTPSNIYVVLFGDKSLVKGGSSKVVDSKPQDCFFIVFSSHEVAGSL
nr:vacuolar-processing enzyme [Tanacetum cinerariifolium]